MTPAERAHCFIIEAHDPELWCPVLQARIHVPDMDVLRAILGEAADGDPELQHGYDLEDDDLAAIAREFGVAFDHHALSCEDAVVNIHRWHRLYKAPYLIHTGYELPLLLDGRKKLARMSHEYPPAAFPGEHQFEHWVAKGVLHREELVVPFESPIKGYDGARTVYYTPKGEEWRIPAMKLIQNAAGKAGGWNEYFERLEGMLFGYEDWQNDWWINVGLERRGFGATDAGR
jgi:hypothetical protein